MKSGLFAALALCLLAAPAARAAPIDMSTVTCAALLSMNQDEVSFTLIWVAGYLAGTEEETSMDPDLLGSHVGRTVEYCKEHQEMSVLIAAEETME